MLMIYQRFFYLLQLGIGKHPQEIISLDERDWGELFDMAIKQSLIGVILEGAQRLSESEANQKPPLPLLYEWIGHVERIRLHNRQMDQKSAMLTRIFNDWGYKSCVLKGQGATRLYPQPELRQSGDIDIWVEGGRDEIVKRLKSNCIGLSFVDYVNCHAGFFTDAEVEVHFRPTWFYNPFVNRKVQKWIEQNKAVQMSNYDHEVGFSYPTIGFNLVFSLIHVYRHIFQEGIGLRQLTDYYFILTHSTAEERSEAMATLKSFGIGKFVAAVMHIEQKVLDIEESYMLCTPNEKDGSFLLDEIMRGANFGHFDDRNNFASSDNRWKHGYNNIRRNFRFLKSYPSEVIWMPIWKVWHYFWRMKKGYFD